MNKRWRLYPQNTSLSSRVSDELCVSPLISQLLLNRGIRSLNDAKIFLDPSCGPIESFPEDTLTSFFNVLSKHISIGSSILIYGDYDVDGITSTTMMVSFLQALGASVFYMLPHRFNDGYGISERLIKTMCTGNYQLLIALDCGISNVNEIQRIREGCTADIMILDHHTIPNPAPKADVIINPKAMDVSHPCYDLCTAGIVYIVISDMCERFNVDFDCQSLLDLAALGTIADVAPLTRVNRRLASEGMHYLSKRQRPGIDALLDIAQFDRSVVSARDVGFTIAPRLNAAGRLGDATMCVSLLLAKKREDAEAIARTLEQLNTDRRTLGDYLLNDAISQIESDPMRDTRKVFVLSGNDWHAGIIGIIASRLVDTYHRPVVMIGNGGDIARGSARSCGGVNMYHLLSTCSDLFMTFGGHKEAAGFSIHPKNISRLKDNLHNFSLEKINNDDLRPILDIDCDVHPKSLTMDFAESLYDLAPFGHGNPQPLFYTNQFRAVDYKTVGGGKHLKATFCDTSNQIVIDSIGFFLADKIDLLLKDQLEIVFHFEINKWNGRSLPQLQIVDIK